MTGQADHRTADASVKQALICHALELILKAVLLFSDYDAFIRRLRPKSKQIPNGFGHELVELAKAASEFYKPKKIKALSPPIVKELKNLNLLYKDQPLLLRYASLHDFFRNSRDIKRDLVIRRMVALVKLIHRKLR